MKGGVGHLARKKQSIRSQVIKDMKSIGIYRIEFRNDIKIYVDMMHEYEVLNEKHSKSGYQLEEEYTNKAGATNMRKTNILGRIEKLELAIAQYSDRLGLNPKSLERITAETKGTSTLARVLSGLD